jgi:hypothetical protein
MPRVPSAILTHFILEVFKQFSIAEIEEVNSPASFMWMLHAYVHRHHLPLIYFAYFFEQDMGSYRPARRALREAQDAVLHVQRAKVLLRRCAFRLCLKSLFEDYLYYVRVNTKFAKRRTLLFPFLRSQVYQYLAPWDEVLNELPPGFDELTKVSIFFKEPLAREVCEEVSAIGSGFEVSVFSRWDFHNDQPTGYYNLISYRISDLSFFFIKVRRIDAQERICTFPLDRIMLELSILFN